jgi:hypothetical protein
MKTRLSARRSHYLSIFSVLLMMTALVAGMAGCTNENYTPPSKDLEIRTWYDLDDVRDNLAGHHRLMNDLDSTSAGYQELAGPAANGGKGWQPIGMITAYGGTIFTGTLDGQGHEICDLFINRPCHEAQCNYVGLVGVLDRGGVVKNIGVVNVTVIGCGEVGGLVGASDGTVSNSYATGNVTGEDDVGGLVGLLNGSSATVSNSYSSANVTGSASVGGLVGCIGYHGGTVSNSYSTGRVSGNSAFGGLVGRDDSNGGTVSNSFWDIQTSGQLTSDGGTGKTTARMKNIATFSDASWNITAVATNETNLAYIWNIVDEGTYPFLSWQS